MGSVSTYRPKGQTTRDWVQANLLADGDQIVASGMSGQTFYAAVRSGDEVWALVMLQQWGRGYFNYWYKTMDEGMGPNEANPPARVLDALTPTDSEWANEWRARARANLAAAAAKPKVRPGQVVVFATDLRFGDGVTEDRFTLVERSTLRRVGDGRMVRIPSWRTRYTWHVEDA